MKIAHISDLHLRKHLPGSSLGNSRRSREVPDLFISAIDEMSTLSPDLVVVTGDICDYPFYAMDDPVMIRRGVRDMQDVADALTRLSCPSIVIRGNHDHPRTFDEVFGGQPDEIEVCGHRVIVFHDDEVNTNVPQRMGSERAKLVRVLSDDDPRPQIHVQHYLVWPEKNEGYPHTYREAVALKEQLVSSGKVRLCLSGHYHPGLAPEESEGAWFAAAPAFTDGQHPWWVYDLDADGLRMQAHATPGNTSQRPAVFLDRDGTINPQPSYRTGPEEMHLIPGAAEALRRLSDAGYALIVISNQSCVGYGWVTAEMVGEVNDRMADLLYGAAGVEFDGIYCCHHSPQADLPEYRADHPHIKPSPGALLDAAELHHIDLSQSWMVGDSISDLEAGRNAGTRTALVRTGHGWKSEEELVDGLADVVTDDISGVVTHILNTDSEQ